MRKIEHNAKGSNSEYSTILYAPYTHNSTRFQHDYPKMKQTKIALRNKSSFMYVLPILGQFLDLISLIKINISEPRFKSYDPWDMANLPVPVL